MVQVLRVAVCIKQLY